MRRDRLKQRIGAAPGNHREAHAGVEHEAFITPEAINAGRRAVTSETEEDRLPEESYFREVVQAVVAGETARFEEIVSLFRDRVYGMAWRMAHDAEDALDISQEVFLRAFSALGSWHGRARFSTWLHRIVINASIDYLRRRSRHQRATESMEAMDPERRSALEAQHTSPDQPRRQAYQRELHREILHAVHRLPRRQRACFVLRHYQECSIRDVAATLRISEGAVKRHLHRAARRLRKDLVARIGPIGG